MKNMKAKEIKEEGFYWWECPIDNGPDHLWGEISIVKVIPSGKYGMLLRAGDPTTWNLIEMPGNFTGPILK